MFKNFNKLPSFINLTRFKIVNKDKTFKNNFNQKFDNNKDMDIYIKKDKLMSDSENNKLNIKKNIDSTHCLVLHPVFNHNRGAFIETYLAEESIGLANSLDWKIVNGPSFGKKSENVEVIPEEEMPDSINLTDGEYLKIGKVIKGVFFKGGVMAGDSDTDEEDVYDEWKNVLLRESLALSSIVRVKVIKSSTFFPKARLLELGNFLKANKNVEIIFINTNLTVIQKRNLEITMNNYINEKNDRIRAYNLKSATRPDGEPTDTESNFSSVENTINNKEDERSIIVMDRFNVILSIFAKRAKSEISQLQIELAYLKYVKSKLNRGGHASFESVYREFSDNFFSNYRINFEIVSGKQSTVKGSVGGSGETQLELEKRKISLRETQIKTQLDRLSERRKIERQVRREKSISLPTIALVGYTNAGKTALMNEIAKTSLESENKLFQTLSTTIKKINLKKNQSALLLDTIGFITDLPHELVESFKSTLEELFFADLLIHVIDISNPLYEYQRQTVYKVLDDIFPKNSEYKKKLIEVWNKIDILDDLSALSDNLEKSEYPIIPISCKKKLNFNMLYDEIENKINMYQGKEMKELRVSLDDYENTYKWLKENINNPTDFKYDEETNEMIITINMDNNQYERYIENFIIKRETKKRNNNYDL